MVKVVQLVAVILLLSAMLKGDVRKPPPIQLREDTESDTVKLQRSWTGIYFSTGPTAYMSPQYFQNVYHTGLDLGGGVIFSKGVVRKSAMPKYLIALGIHYHRYSPDLQSAVDATGWSDFHPSMSGGETKFLMTDVEFKLAPRWLNAPVEPFLTVKAGGGKIFVDDLVLREENSTFIFQGFRQWVGTVGFGVGLQDNLSSHIGFFVDVIYNFLGGFEATSSPMNEYPSVYYPQHDEQYHSFLSLKAALILR